MKKLETQSTVLLKHHLKALKLPTMTAECEKVAARCAKENVDHPGFLLQLCELELLERERRAAARRLKAAKLPTPKALDTFDFTAAPSVNKPLILEHRREQPVGLFCLDGRPHLKLVAVPMPDLAAYACLTAGVAP